MSKKALRTFRCDAWMSAGINVVAEDLGISDSEWIRKAIVKALLAEGYDRLSYIEDQRTAREAINGYYNPQVDDRFDS